VPHLRDHPVILRARSTRAGEEGRLARGE